MAKRTKPPEDWIVKELPIVGELKGCRQISADHWQGTD